MRLEWLDFVEKIFPIKEEREIAHVFFGYLLRRDHPEKIFAICKAMIDGFNGKSKFVQAILAAIGTYGKNGNNNHIYENKGFRNQNGHDSSMFAYDGINAAFFEELSDKQSLDNKKMKDMNGGNSSGTGRRPMERLMR